MTRGRRGRREKNPKKQPGKEEGEGCRGRLAYCGFGFSSGCDGSNADSSFWMTVDETALALFLRPELSTTSPSPPSEMRLCTPCSRRRGSCEEQRKNFLFFSSPNEKSSRETHRLANDGAFQCFKGSKAYVQEQLPELKPASGLQVKSRYILVLYERLKLWRCQGAIQLVVQVQRIRLEASRNQISPPWPAIRNARWPIPWTVDGASGYFWSCEET
ncbi:hypothetical protein J3F84DRAFT_52107 [Trichoderma pleuroticola]